MTAAHPLLIDYRVVIEHTIMWGEMDALEHVNNTAYFRWFETARVAYFDQLGFRIDGETGLGPILASTSCRFRLPLTYPDRVLIGSRVTDVGADRFTMLHRAVSLRLDAVAAEGEGVVVCYDYGNRRKAGLPPELTARIIELEGTARTTP